MEGGSEMEKRWFTTVSAVVTTTALLAELWMGGGIIPGSSQPALAADVFDAAPAMSEVTVGSAPDNLDAYSLSIPIVTAAKITSPSAFLKSGTGHLRSLAARNVIANSLFEREKHSLEGSNTFIHQGWERPAASPLQPSDLSPSYKEVNLDHAAPGDTVEYTIHVVNEGSATTAYLADYIPWVLDFVPGSEWASSGDVSFNSDEGAIEWLGDVPAGGEVQVGFEATVSRLAAAGQPIVNVAGIYDYGTGAWHYPDATTIATTTFTGYDNAGKIAVDGGWGGGEGESCGSWECEWYECADPCEVLY
jgi:uncharacterized repeat protein (TIGR01451 family)